MQDKKKGRLAYNLKVREAFEIRRHNSGPGKGLNEDNGAYLRTDIWDPVLNTLDTWACRRNGNKWGEGGDQPLIGLFSFLNGFSANSGFSLSFSHSLSMPLLCLSLYKHLSASLYHLATDDDMKIHKSKISGKKSFCIAAQTLHNENHFHIMSTTSACDDVQRKNKAYKANDASSWWWNDCMIVFYKTWPTRTF